MSNNSRQKGTITIFFEGIIRYIGLGLFTAGMVGLGTKSFDPINSISFVLIGLAFIIIGNISEVSD